MWEHKFSEEEVAEANRILNIHHISQVSHLAIARSRELSTIQDTGMIELGRDTVSVHLEHGNMVTVFSFIRYDFLDESESTEIVAERTVLETDNSGHTLEALALNVLAECRKDLLEELHELNSAEMIAISSVTKILLNNRG